LTISYRTTGLPISGKLLKADVPLAEKMQRQILRFAPLRHNFGLNGRRDLSDHDALEGGICSARIPQLAQKLSPRDRRSRFTPRKRNQNLAPEGCRMPVETTPKIRESVVDPMSSRQ
jgi:hypothetical protein